MWSRRITSGISDYKTAKDVTGGLLKALVERNSGGWAHFETVADGGYFSNLLSGKQPWIEVALATQSTLQVPKKSLFELNIGIRKSKIGLMPSIPNKWPQRSRNFYSVPIDDLDELLDWIFRCLAAASGKENCKITGWLDGI